MTKAVAGLLLLFLIGAAMPGKAAFAAEPLVLAYGNHFAMPYVAAEHGDLADGIIRDLGLELGRRLDRPVTFRAVPRKRQEAMLVNGEVDLYCTTNPQWLEHGDQVDWSPPLIDEGDVLAIPAGAPPIAGLDDLNGKRLGAILGFRYVPAIERRFAAHQLVREDALSDEANFAKLKEGRIDGLIASRLVLLYHRAHKIPPDLRLVDLPGANQAGHCAIARKAGLPLQIFQQMKDDGAIDRILAKYR